MEEIIGIHAEETKLFIEQNLISLDEKLWLESFFFIFDFRKMEKKVNLRFVFQSNGILFHEHVSCLSVHVKKYSKNIFTVKYDFFEEFWKKILPIAFEFISSIVREKNVLGSRSNLATELFVELLEIRPAARTVADACVENADSTVSLRPVLTTAHAHAYFYAWIIYIYIYFFIYI